MRHVSSLCLQHSGKMYIVFGVREPPWEMGLYYSQFTEWDPETRKADKLLQRHTRKQEGGEHIIMLDALAPEQMAQAWSPGATSYHHCDLGKSLCLFVPGGQLDSPLRLIVWRKNEVTYTKSSECIGYSAYSQEVLVIMILIIFIPILVYSAHHC